MSDRRAASSTPLASSKAPAPKPQQSRAWMGRLRAAAHAFAQIVRRPWRRSSSARRPALPVFASLKSLHQAGLLFAPPTPSATDQASTKEASDRANVVLAQLRASRSWLRPRPPQPICSDASTILIHAPSEAWARERVVIPNLLQWRGNALVRDVDGWIWKTTSRWRQQALGQSVHLFHPMDARGRSHRYNPLDPVRSASPEDRTALAQTLAHILILGTSPSVATDSAQAPSRHASAAHDPQALACHALTGLVLYLIDSRHAECTLTQLLHTQALHIPAHGASFDALRLMQSSPEPLSADCQTHLWVWAQANEAAREAGQRLLEQALVIYTLPNVAWATACSDWSWSQFLNSPCSLYLHLPSAETDGAQRLMHLVFAQAQAAQAAQPAQAAQTPQPTPTPCARPLRMLWCLPPEGLALPALAAPSAAAPLRAMPARGPGSRSYSLIYRAYAEGCAHPIHSPNTATRIELFFAPQTQSQLRAADRLWNREPTLQADHWRRWGPDAVIVCPHSSAPLEDVANSPALARALNWASDAASLQSLAQISALLRKALAQGQRGAFAQWIEWCERGEFAAPLKTSLYSPPESPARAAPMRLLDMLQARGAQSAASQATPSPAAFLAHSSTHPNAPTQAFTVSLVSPPSMPFAEKAADAADAAQAIPLAPARADACTPEHVDARPLWSQAEALSPSQWRHWLSRALPHYTAPATWADWLRVVNEVVVQAAHLQHIDWRQHSEPEILGLDEGHSAERVAHAIAANVRAHLQEHALPAAEVDAALLHLHRHLHTPHAWFGRLLDHPTLAYPSPVWAQACVCIRLLTPKGERLIWAAGIEPLFAGHHAARVGETLVLAHQGVRQTEALAGHSASIPGQAPAGHCGAWWMQTVAQIHYHGNHSPRLLRSGTEGQRPSSLSLAQALPTGPGALSLAATPPDGAGSSSSRVGAASAQALHQALQQRLQNQGMPAALIAQSLNVAIEAWVSLFASPPVQTGERPAASADPVVSGPAQADPTRPSTLLELRP